MIGFLSWVDTTPPMMPNNQLGQGEYTILEELSYFYDFEFLDTDVESFEGIDLLIVYHPLILVTKLNMQLNNLS